MCSTEGKRLSLQGKAQSTEGRALSTEHKWLEDRAFWAGGTASDAHHQLGCMQGRVGAKGHHIAMPATLSTGRNKPSHDFSEDWLEQEGTTETVLCRLSKECIGLSAFRGSAVH